MKKLLSVLLICLFAVVLIGCDNTTPDPTPDQPAETTKYTVILNVDGARYKTLKVEEGKTIGAVDAPTKEGYTFKAWSDGKNEVDLTTFVVTKNVTFEAVFTQNSIDSSLVVDAVKEEGKTYYLVVGWWETTDVDAEGNPKVTSSLTPDTVRVFYANLILYLKKFGATDADIKNIQFRNYSTVKVADMGALVNADGDVDLMIGVGNNINSQAGVSLLDGDNDNKVGNIMMGTTPIARYVALLKNNPAAVSVFDWIKGDEVGKTAFTAQLTADKIVLAPARVEEVINLTVNVYGTNPGDVATTVLTNRTDVVQIPEINVPEGKEFSGWAFTSGAESADIYADLSAELTYDSFEDFLAENQTEIDLYPIFSDYEEIISDLVVFLHMDNGSSTYITSAEMSLLMDRFTAILEDPKNIEFQGVCDKDVAGFNKEVVDAGNVDVVIGGKAIGSKTPTLTFAENGALAQCGAYHFANTSRYVGIIAESEHADLAKKLYDFLIADAPAKVLTFAFWRVGTWVSDARAELIPAEAKAHLNTYFGVDDVQATYGIQLSFYTIDPSITKVAALSTATKELRDGAGVEMIIGCGGNVDDEGNMGDAVLLVFDAKETVLGVASRKVAICTFDSLITELAHNYFGVSEF